MPPRVAPRPEAPDRDRTRSQDKWAIRGISPGVVSGCSPPPLIPRARAGAWRCRAVSCRRRGRLDFSRIFALNAAGGVWGGAGAGADQPLELESSAFWATGRGVGVLFPGAGAFFWTGRRTTALADSSGAGPRLHPETSNAATEAAHKNFKMALGIFFSRADATHARVGIAG